MIINHNFSLALLIISGLIMSACVTINIYFPAAAAEKVVDKIIDEVWQADDENDGKDQKKSDKGTRNGSKTDNKLDRTKP